MARGNQLKSRREKMRKMIGEEVVIKATYPSDDEQGISFSYRGKLEFKSPDGGYFLKDTKAQIFLNYIKSIDLEKKLINIDMSERPIPFFPAYEGVKYGGMRK